jgi:hypothetical protein
MGDGGRPGRGFRPAGQEPAVAEPRNTEYPGSGHQCYNKAYTTTALHDFFLANKKKSLR